MNQIVNLLLKFFMTSFLVVPGLRFIEGMRTRFGVSAEKLALFSVAVESLILSFLITSEFSLSGPSSSLGRFLLFWVSEFVLGLLPEIVLLASILPSQACGTGVAFLLDFDI